MERLPTLEEILANPAFTEAEKNEAREMFARFERERTELDAQIIELDKQLKLLRAEILEAASKGMRVNKDVLASILLEKDNEARDNIKPKPKTEPEEITW